MSRHPFGWSLPPGVTDADIDAQFAEDPEEEWDGDDDEACDPEAPAIHPTVLRMIERREAARRQGGE